MYERRRRPINDSLAIARGVDKGIDFRLFGGLLTILCGTFATASGKDATRQVIKLDPVNHALSMTRSPVLQGGCCVVWGEPLPLFPLAQRGPTSSVAPRITGSGYVSYIVFVRPLCEKGEDVASSPFSFHESSAFSKSIAPVRRGVFLPWRCRRFTWLF